MTRQRALRLAREWAQGHVCSLRDGEAAEYHSMFAAMLKEAQPNEPLTIEELREMDGDKIAIHYIGDCAGFYEDEIAPYYGDQEQYIQRYNGMLRACDLPLKYYGTQWTATLYRRPPEGEEDT